MNKKTFTIFFCILGMTAQAQIFLQAEMEFLGECGDRKVATVSPKGDFVLTTDGGHRGLTRIDIGTGRQTTLTQDSGAGYQPVLSEDGLQVIYRHTIFSTNQERLTAVKALTIENGETREMQPAQRVIPAYGWNKGTPFALNPMVAKRIQVTELKGLSGTEAKPMAVFLEDLQLMTLCNGQSVQLSPNGTDKSYIWPSLSPDGKKILYYVSGEGAYVCHTDGSHVKFIAHECKAPQWYDNNTVIGMDDKDDGERVISSCIVAYTLDGKIQRLTQPESLTMYPQCAPKAGLVACSTAEGKICLLRLTR